MTKSEKASDAVEGVQTEELYDYLYRDSGRIASFYAQVFGGRLSSFERSKAEKTTTEGGGKINLAVASGDMKHGGESGTGLKQTYDPHDLIATDLLSILTSQGRITQNIVAAKHGSLVHVEGTLIFVDRSMMEMATASLEAIAKSAAGTIGAAVETETMNGFGMLVAFLKVLQVPSAFILQITGGCNVVGTIKDAGMEEPIPTYYFKHGLAGLSGVHLIGIKEVATQAMSIPVGQLIGASQQAAEALGGLLFPKEAIRVTPIAMFRKI